MYIPHPLRCLAHPAVRALGAELAQVIGHMHELAVFAKWEWLPSRPHTVSDKHILAAQHACRKLLNGEGVEGARRRGGDWQGEWCWKLPSHATCFFQERSPPLMHPLRPTI